MEIETIRWVGMAGPIELAKQRMREKDSYKAFMLDYPYGMAADPQIRRVKEDIWQYYAEKYPDSIWKDNERVEKWTLAEFDQKLLDAKRSLFNIPPGAQPAPVPGGGKGKSRRNRKSKKSKKSKKGKQSRKARKTRIKSNRRRGPR